MGVPSNTVTPWSCPGAARGVTAILQSVVHAHRLERPASPLLQSCTQDAAGVMVSWCHAYGGSNIGSWIVLAVSLAQPHAKLLDGSRHKAGLANLAPCLLRLQAKLSEKADGWLAQAAVGLNRERDEGVPIRLQLAICPPLL
jgi:hypothetical protein